MRFIDDQASATTTTRTIIPVDAFRISASTVLLTYSQCDGMTKQDVLYTLEERLPPFDYAIGQEEHSDGGLHIHALLKTKQGKFETRQADYFDVAISDALNFHPNIRTIKRGKANFDRAHEYVEKEDTDPLCTFPHTLTWGEIITNSSCAEEYLELIKTNYPRDWAKDLQRFEYSAKKLFPMQDPNTIPEGYTIDYEHEDLDLEASFERSLVIVGPPGCGKTTWAKKWSPKPALFIRHLDSLALFRPEHRSIIFDDLDFKHLPVSTQKYLVDYENLAEIHCRYRVARIPAGVPRIFTCNEYPLIDEGVHGQAIDRRVNKFYL